MSKEQMKLRGFSRVQIAEKDGKIVGDSGWCGPNQITLEGFKHLGYGVFYTANATQADSIGLGTGGAPASNATKLDGELSDTGGSTLRCARSLSLIGSKTHRLYGTRTPMAIGAGSNISNIGIFFGTQTNKIFGGNTYASSALASNQSVYFTYDIQLS